MALVLLAVVGTAVVGRLAESNDLAMPSSAVVAPPSATSSAAVSPGQVFAAFACPPPLLGIGRPEPPEPVTVSRPGSLVTVAPSSAWLDLVTVDHEAVWVLARGRVVRLDPVTREALGSWSYADAPLFAPDGIAPGARGGIWMWDRTGVRRFVGDSFVDVLPMPTGGPFGSLADAGERGVWIAGPAGDPPGFALYRWTGGAWTRSRPCDDPSAPDGGWSGTSPASLAVDPTGRVVAVDAVGTAVRIRRFDGSRWTAFVGMRALVDPGTQPNVAIGADGTVYVATGRAIGRFDGTTWISSAIGASHVTVLGDGSVAVSASTPLGDAEVSHLDPTTLRPRAGEAPVLFDGPVAALAPASEGLLVASPAAIGTGLAFVSFPTPGRSLTVRSVAADVPWLRGARDHPGAPVLALSRDEAWFGSWEGIAWHLTGRALTPRDVSAGAASTIRAIAQGRDGSVWIGHDADLTIVKPTGASVEVAVDAVSIAPRSDGSTWLLGSDGTALVGSLFESGAIIDAVARPPFDWGARIVADADGTAWALGGSLSGPGLVVVHLVAGEWRVVPPPAGVAIVTIAADPDRGIWGLASRSDGRLVLVRDDGRGWRPAGDVPMLGATDLAVGHDGIVWVAGDALARTDGAGRWETVAGSSATHDTTRRFYAPSVAPDGTVFVVCPSGICRYSVAPAP